jgi:hypothetical protein
MENDAFQPSSKKSSPEPSPRRGKDPYAEPPVKDFSHLLTGKPAPKSHHGIRKVLTILILTVVLVGVSGGVYWRFFYNQPQAQAMHKTQKTLSAAKQSAATPTANYTSTGFGVTLTYPRTWAISDGGSTSLSVASPIRKLTNSSKRSVNGKIVVVFQPQGQIPTALGTSGATAVLDSQVIKFTSPSSSQAAQTYLSFVQYSSATMIGTLNAIYITGNYGYQKDGVIPQSDLTGLNPLITVTFGQCTTSACTSLEDLSISSAEWSNTSFSMPILNILKSLTFS